MKKECFSSALSVQQGIDQPEQLNPYWKKRLAKELSVVEFTNEILAGNRVVLSQAITLVESMLPEHFNKAQQIIEKVLPHAGKSIRIGITGVPGVGKSTFIEAFGTFLTSQGHRVAILAIDPSSERSGGSILGDKTRMEHLSINPKAFIRPSPSGLTLGGVARKTRETMLLCEAAGFDVIIVETVGVGQSETVVKTMVDFFLLMMLAGAGDELQGIKRGIMEMADAILINKADGDNIEKAQIARNQYQTALHLFPKLENQWNVPVLTCSALLNTGIEEIWQQIAAFAKLTKDNGSFEEQRKKQMVNIFNEWIDYALKRHFYAIQGIEEELQTLTTLIKEGVISPYKAGERVEKTRILPMLSPP
jgi:LAO/AO transport system kinase